MNDEKTQASEKRHAGPGIYIAFVPWLLFGVIVRQDSLIAAAIVALLAATAISAPGVVHGRPKVLELGTVLAFVGFTIAATLLDSSASAWLARYARAISASLLALIAFGSLLRTPFTEQYARETVPREWWSSERFKHVNRSLTAMWGLVFAAMVPSHVIAGAIDTRRGNTIFNWLIPIALIIWAAKRTARVSDGDGVVAADGSEASDASLAA
ncbi:MAG TPA: hypothetical protein VH081_08730 [Solirubrobacteraceae bacterium]|jgi:hypothetical protein|nr:hypothetical protein [Solirubrobacteraceae bacterium]